MWSWFSKVESKQATAHMNGLILYKFDRCPYCVRVFKAIERLNCSSKIEMRDTREDPKWKSDLLARTGRTQVPCLFIEGEALFESLDIVEFLDEHFSSPNQSVD